MGWEETGKPGGNPRRENFVLFLASRAKSRKLNFHDQSWKLSGQLLKCVIVILSGRLDKGNAQMHPQHARCGLDSVALRPASGVESYGLQCASAQLSASCSSPLTSGMDGVSVSPGASSDSSEEQQSYHRNASEANSDSEYVRSVRSESSSLIMAQPKIVPAAPSRIWVSAVFVVMVALQVASTTGLFFYLNMSMAQVNNFLLIVTLRHATQHTSLHAFAPRHACKHDAIMI